MPVFDLNNTAKVYRGSQEIAALFRGTRALWSSSLPNPGVGTDTPIMFAGGSLPIGIAYNWWGGADGEQAGTVGHSMLSSTRGDYVGTITTSALGEALSGVGMATSIGIDRTSQWLWDRWEGEWPEYGDPRGDMPLYAGGAFIHFEAESLIGEDWIAASRGKLAQPYVWRSNSDRITLTRDLEYEYNLFALAAQNGVQPYIGGSWPPMVISPSIDDAAWRARIDFYDIAHRYRRRISVGAACREQFAVRCLDHPDAFDVCAGL